MTATAQAQKTDPFLNLMTTAKAHASAHGARVAPVLSPVDATLLGASPAVDVAALHKIGVAVVPWTTNDPAKMRALLALHVDGIITDRPDVLQSVLKEARSAAASKPAELAYLDKVDVTAHRGGRGLRPEKYPALLRVRPGPALQHAGDRHRRLYGPRPR